MIPHKVELGERYSDDSGWERLVSIDMHAQRFDVEMGGSGLHYVNVSELDWLIKALTKARELVADYRPGGDGEGP